jgi:hypothetical protein
MKSSHYYPEQYWEATELAVRDGSWSIDLGEKSKANSMRVTYQNWRAALKAEEQMEKFFVAARIIAEVKGTVLTLRDRNRTGVGAVLEAALRTERSAEVDIMKMWKERKKE